MMKYLPTSFIKKLIWGFVVFSVFLSAVLFNPYGLPVFLQKYLLEKLRQYQVLATCENIIVSPFSGVVFIGLRGSYEIEDGAFFIQADQFSIATSLVDLVMKGEKVKSISLSGALASFYVKKSKDSYTINDATGTLYFQGSTAQISDAKMSLSGIPIEVQGRVSSIDFGGLLGEKITADEIESSKVVADSNPKLKLRRESFINYSSKLKFILKQIKSKEVKKRIKLSFDLDATQPISAIVKIDAEFSNLSLLNGTIEDLSVKAIYQEKELSVTRLKLSSTRGETVSLSAHYHFDTQKLRGEASVKMFPQTVINTAMQMTDADLSEFNLITSNHKIDIKLKMPEQVVSKTPAIVISAFAKEFTLYGDVLAQDLYVDASWKENALYFDITKGKVNKNTDVACKGVWDLLNDVVLLTFQVVGNPYFAHHFIPPASAKRGFTGTLDLFTWDDALPPFINLSLRINYGQNFNLQLMGDVRASDVNMKNMKYKTLSTQFEVISDDTHLGISFNKIDAIDDKDREMHGSIFYTIPPDGDYGKLTIDANTEVPIDEILESFELETDFLDSMQNWDGFYAEANGVYDIDHSERSDLLVKGETDKLELYGIKISKAVGSVAFSRGQVFIPRIDGLIEGIKGFGGYYYDSETENAACNISFKGMNFEKASFNRKKDPIKGYLDFNADVGLRFLKDKDIPNLSGFGSLVLRDTDSPLKIPYIGSIYSGLMKTISRGKWGGQLATITASLSFIKDEIRVDDLKTDGSVVAIESKGSVFLARKEVDFIIKALPVQNFLWKLIPTLSSSFTNNATIRVKGPFDKIEWKTQFMK